jgi:outer membrane protein OmpA-like peptidoglycan-associated protein
MMRRPSDFPAIGWSRRAALAALLLAALPAHAQAPARAKSTAIVEGFQALETGADIDVAALRKQTLDRIKKARTNAERNPVNRPPISEALLNEPQQAIDIKFKEDSATISSASYPLLGRIADALYHPDLLVRRLLIVVHTESGGRREDNIVLSQRRADAIRDALVSAFHVNSKRIEAVGLGEEQLLDRRNPKAPATQRVQLVAMGKFVVAPPEGAAAQRAAPQRPGAGAKPAKRRAR